LKLNTREDLEEFIGFIIEKINEKEKFISSIKDLQIFDIINKNFITEDMKTRISMYIYYIFKILDSYVLDKLNDLYNENIM
jgi:hypothetical protein